MEKLQKQYKAIGWVVEWRIARDDEWFCHPLDVRRTKQEAIDLWTGRTDRLFGGKKQMRNGLARAKRVYVEVKP